MLTFSTQSPQQLLQSIKAEIQAGKIVTWSFDADGDFTHTPEQWKYSAWLRPFVRSGQLVFGIIPSRNKSMSKEIYAVYHGRFIEMMQGHFDGSFASATASALLVSPDVF
jgi:hypothetical protein